VSQRLRNLLDEAGVAVVLDVQFLQLLLLFLPLVPLHVVLPVLVPLLGVVHHLPPLALQLLWRELPTNVRILLESIRCGR